MAHRIGIIGAMDEEIKLLNQNVYVTRLVEIAGITFYEGTLHGVEVVFCKSGVGKVNAAVTTQLLFNFKVESVWFTGVAGALHPRLDVGDIVISSTAVQHDIDATALGYAKGVIPYQETSEFVADEKLVGLAVQAAEQLYPNRSIVGKVLSGDQFIADINKVNELFNTHAGVCAEMEGAAVAQVCTMNNKPFVVIRSISDKADGSADVTYNEFVNEAANNSYSIIEHMIQQL